jgi:ribosomal protein S18 acetylase RimI-like enzyme
MNAIARDHYGTTELTEEEWGAWFAHDQLDVVLAEHDGRIVGYGDRWREPERDRAWLDVAVRSGESSTAEALLLELERRAHPDVDPGALAMTYVAEVDSTVRAAVEESGYTLVRHSFRMATLLAGALPSPEWPSGIRVETYGIEQEAAVHAAHQEAFADHWEHKPEPLPEWRKWLVENPSFDPSFWFIARDGKEIAGLSLCRIHASGDVEHGFVSVLAVRRPWRRRGLGTALLQHSFLEMRARGMRKASLGVDGENTTGAVRLYERAGMDVDRRYDCYRKEL